MWFEEKGEFGVRGKGGVWCEEEGGIWCEEEGGGETEKILPNMFLNFYSSILGTFFYS